MQSLVNWSAGDRLVSRPLGRSFCHPGGRRRLPVISRRLAARPDASNTLVTAHATHDLWKYFLCGRRSVGQTADPSVVPVVYC